MAAWTVSPDCLEVKVDSEKIVRVIDSLWVGISFSIAFSIGCMLGALISWLCFRKHNKTKKRDTEDASFLQQNIPSDGVQFSRIIDFLCCCRSNSNMPTESILVHQDNSSDWAKGESVTYIDEKYAGLSDTLIKTTRHGALAELSSQDAREYTNLDNSIRNQRLEAFMLLLRSMLNKLIANHKMTKEEVEGVISDMGQKYDTIVDRNKSETIEAMQNITDDETRNKDSIALQAEIDSIQAKRIHNLNSELSTIEANIPQHLISIRSVGEDDVEDVLNMLRHRMTIREKKIEDEIAMQMRVLEERMARRNEFAELHRLNKESIKNILTAKVKGFTKATGLLVSNCTITEQQKNEILEEYEKDLWRIQEAYDEDLSAQQQLLHEKLSKRRTSKIGELDIQQRKSKAKIVDKLSRSNFTTYIRPYDVFIQKQQLEREQFITDVDNEEFQKFNQLTESLERRYTSRLNTTDMNMSVILKSKTGMDRADVQKLINLHKAEMRKYYINRDDERKIMHARLQKNLKLRQQHRQAAEEERQAAFQLLRDRQGEVVQKLITSHAALSDKSAKQIMEQHQRNMIVVTNQLTISKLKQEKQIEERLALRRLALTEKKQRHESLAKTLNRGVEGKEMQIRLKKEISTEAKAINEERGKQLELLRERLADERTHALAVQEEQMSDLIGRLEVGRARRRTILMKQDKLIGELEDQLANKVRENPRRFSTATEFMQKHYGQVENLTNTLQTARTRQQLTLQDKLEKRCLEREVQINVDLRDAAQREMEMIRTRGVGTAADTFLEMMLQQRHERQLKELEKEMKAEMKIACEQMAAQLDAEMMNVLSEDSRNLMSKVSAGSRLTNKDIMAAMSSVASGMKSAV